MSPHLSSGHGFPKFWGHIWKILTANRTEFWAYFWKLEKFWNLKKKSNTNTNNIFLPFIWPFIGKFSAYFCPFQQVLKNKKTIIFLLAVFGLFFSFCALFLHAFSIYLLPFLKIIFFSQFSRLVFSFVCPFFSLFVCIKDFFVTFLSKFCQFSTYRNHMFKPFLVAFSSFCLSFFGPFYASVWFLL